MKVLFLVRHAKSSWKNASLPDHNRPLNERGRGDAPRMGKRLADRHARPDLIVSSSAVRAVTTARMLADQLGHEPAHVVVDPNLYGADALGLLAAIKGFDDQHNRIMLVGHNPAVTDLVNQLTDTAIDNVPTCGIVILSFAMDSWTTARKGAARLLDFDYPKRIDA